MFKSLDCVSLVYHAYEYEYMYVYVCVLVLVLVLELVCMLRRQLPNKSTNVSMDVHSYICMYVRASVHMSC